tara:strand:- start:525 stop:797 length:273 start_codon:yes stop_codon:yes gene_type:complete
MASFLNVTGENDETRFSKFFLSMSPESRETMLFVFETLYKIKKESDICRKSLPSVNIIFAITDLSEKESEFIIDTMRDYKKIPKIQDSNK